MSEQSIPQSIRTLLHDPSNHSLSLTQHPAPSPSLTHHLIQVRATALTNGELLWPEPHSLSHPVPGFDVAGVLLTSVPKSNFRKGDEVYALTAFNRQGAAREITEVLPEELALKPKNLDWAEAATVPMSALTAWQALFVHGGIPTPPLASYQTIGSASGAASTERKRVLITAASGGVGLYAIQLAKFAGAYVVGTCSSRNVHFVKSLGANEVLDYTQPDQKLREWLLADPTHRRFDLVLDCVGGKSLEESWTAVKENGLLISIVQPPDLAGMRPETDVAGGAKGLFFIVKPDGEMLGFITRWIEDGKVRAVVDNRWKLEEWEKAMERAGSGRARGKVVLVVRE